MIGVTKDYTRLTATVTCSPTITYSATVNSSLSYSGAVAGSTIVYTDATSKITYTANDRNLDGRTVVIFVQALVK